MRPSQRTRADYHVTASSRRTAGGTAVPVLKVVRLSDDRIIYPFQGRADMPFFPEQREAQDYAETYGWKLVDGISPFPNSRPASPAVKRISLSDIFMFLTGALQGRRTGIPIFSISMLS